MTDSDKHIKKIVRETLEGMGFKKDDAYAIHNDLVYLRKMRKSREEMWNFIRKSLIGVAVPTVLYLLWEAFKMTTHK